MRLARHGEDGLAQERVLLLGPRRPDEVEGGETALRLTFGGREDEEDAVHGLAADLAEGPRGAGMG